MSLPGPVPTPDPSVAPGEALGAMLPARTPYAAEAFRLGVRAVLHPDKTARIAALTALQKCGDAAPLSFAVHLRALQDPATVQTGAQGLQLAISASSRMHRLPLTLAYFAVDAAANADQTNELQLLRETIERQLARVPREFARSVQNAITAAGSTWWRDQALIESLVSQSESPGLVFELLSTRLAMQAFQPTDPEAAVKSLQQTAKWLNDPVAIAAVLTLAPAKLDLRAIPQWAPHGEILAQQTLRAALEEPEEAVRVSALARLVQHAPFQPEIPLAVQNLLDLLNEHADSPCLSDRPLAVAHAIASAPGVHEPILQVSVVREALRMALAARDRHAREDAFQLALTWIERLPGSAFPALMTTLAEPPHPPGATRAPDLSPREAQANTSATHALSLIAARRLSSPELGVALIHFASATRSPELIDQIARTLPSVDRDGTATMAGITRTLSEPRGSAGRDMSLVNCLSLLNKLPREFLEARPLVTTQLIARFLDRTEHPSVRGSALDTLTTRNLLTEEQARDIMLRSTGDITIRGTARQHLKKIAERFGLPPPTF